jgi:hypothetical protein
LLAYGWGFGGLNFARFNDLEVYDFQIYRTVPGIIDNNGPGGHFYHYSWNGSTHRYNVSGPYHWKANWVGQGTPWQLPADTDPKQQWSISHAGWDGTMTEWHHYNAPNGHRQTWGKTYGESFIAYGLQNLPFKDGGAWIDPHGNIGHWEMCQGPYTFLRALDTEFRSFQLFWGVEQSYQFYLADSTPALYMWYRKRSGEAIHFDVASGTQDLFTWTAVKSG